jgi:hypothetical protein
LNFIDEDENHINKPKNDQYMKKLDNSGNNVFETEENTVNLVNDIVLLSEEERYMKNVKNIVKNEIENKNEDAIFLYDKELYSVSRHNIKGVYSGKTYHSFNQTLDNSIRGSKINKNWVIESEQTLTLITPWNREEFGNAIGGRISNPCGNITYACLYPVLSMLGSLTSVLIGF